MKWTTKKTKVFKDLFIPARGKYKIKVPELHIKELSGDFVLVFKKNLIHDSTARSQYKVVRNKYLVLDYNRRVKTLSFINETKFNIKARLIVVSYIPYPAYIIQDTTLTLFAKEDLNDNQRS